MQTQQAVTDPFLPVSIGAPGNDLAACFDQMVVLQPAAAAEDPKPAGNDANDFDVLTHPFANMR